MKKLAVIMLFALAAFSQVAFAQNSTPFKVDAHKFAEEYDAAAKTTTNTRVLDNFSRMFKDASNVIWSKDKHVDRVYFESKGKVTRAAFNQKGQFLYSITSYGEEYLPKDILMMVKDTYFGKSIFGVSEVNALGKTAYIIILEDKTSWLHIKVLDNEISEEKVLLKSN
jgi:hypothetical protein